MKYELVTLQSIACVNEAAQNLTTILLTIDAIKLANIVKELFVQLNLGHQYRIKAVNKDLSLTYHRQQFHLNYQESKASVIAIFDWLLSLIASTDNDLVDARHIDSLLLEYQL